MSGRKKHDWSGLIQEFVLTKTKEPLLTHTEFFRRKQIHRPSGSLKIGTKMTLAWEESRKKALSHVVEKAGINLAEELEKQFRALKAGFTLGARSILPRVAEDGTEIPAHQQAATFAESLMLMKTCGDGIREITKLLTGGEPLLPPVGKKDKAEAERAKLQAIMKNPKALEHAQKLLEELGPTFDVGNSNE